MFEAQKCAATILQEHGCDSMMAETFFELPPQTLTGIEKDEYSGAVLTALEKIKPTLSTIIHTKNKSGSRTKAAWNKWNRLCAYISGSVDFTDSSIVLRKSKGTTSLTPTEQRKCFDKYYILLSTLFPTGKFNFCAHNLTKTGYFDEMTARAILDAPSSICPPSPLLSQ